MAEANKEVEVTKEFLYERSNDIALLMKGEAKKLQETFVGFIAG